MLHITAFGTIIYFASGGRWFRTLDREHLRDVLEACGGEKASSENQFVHWVDEADPDNPKKLAFYIQVFCHILGVLDDGVCLSRQQYCRAWDTRI